MTTEQDLATVDHARGNILIVDDAGRRSRAPIIEAHGGRIWLADAELGASVRFLLPAS